LQISGPERKRDHAQIRAPIRLALIEPEIAPNVGAVLRLGACLGVPVHVVEPCGFPFSPRAWRRQAMDYADLAELHRHDSWEAFLEGRSHWRRPGRLLALAPGGEAALWGFRFAPGDTLLLGRESTGLAQAALAAADARLRVPMQPGARSLNLAMAAAIAAAEAVRQLRPHSTGDG
jgi:tRNA (cytidine/uridine-2'-O-)-methyltransferase